MLRIIISTLLMCGAIFCGMYNPSDWSPHNEMLHYVGIKQKLTKWMHIILGTIFYLLAVIVI